MRPALAALLFLIMAGPANSLDLQGHRGARGLMPENTLPAFAQALTIGVTTLELDTAVTRDGVVVVSHDATLNPDITRDAQGRTVRSAAQVSAGEQMTTQLSDGTISSTVN
jgi:glycerophosphoryl diester phosphodiesterase